MAREFARAFYHSQQWKGARDAYMARPVDTPAGICPAGLCEKCFARGLLHAAEIVHHKEHLDPSNISDPSVSLGFGNLERVCRKCHAEEHPEVYGMDEPKEGPRVGFDSEGNVVKLDGD